MSKYCYWSSVVSPRVFSFGTHRPNSFCEDRRFGLVLRVILPCDRLLIAPTSSYSSMVNEGFTLFLADGRLADFLRGRKAINLSGMYRVSICILFAVIA